MFLFQVPRRSVKVWFRLISFSNKIYMSLFVLTNKKYEETQRVKAEEKRLRNNPSFTVCLQASLSVAVTSQESVFMPSVWKARLHMFLKRSWGRPVGLFSVASSPYKRSFGMRPSFISVTYPSHHMRLCFERVYKLGIPPFSSTTFFVTLSCHVIPRIRLRQRT